jgi:DNA-directed RNA polymerase specialized sigma24 family protein
LIGIFFETSILKEKSLLTAKTYKVMNFRIINENLEKNKNEINQLKKLINNRITEIKHLDNEELKNVTAEFYFENRKNGDYQLSAIVKAKNEIFFFQKKHLNPEVCVSLLFNEMELKLQKKFYQENKSKLKKQQAAHHKNFSQHIFHLKRLKNEGSKELFDSLLKILLRQIPNYIKRRLQSAQAAHYVKKGRFELRELIDELYLIIYDNVEKIPFTLKESKIWLYQKADELLNEKLKEAEFEKNNMEQLENLQQIELENMEETFSVDAEYEIVPTEDLDDYKLSDEKYTANDLFVSEDEESILSDIMLTFNKDEIHAIIQKELLHLPVMKRTILDLYLLEQLSVEEIASIKKLSEREVEAIIHEVTFSLKKKLIEILKNL